MGEASLRQMFVNSHAFIHAHQWVLVVLGLSRIPPPLIKKPNTSQLPALPASCFEEKFLPDSNNASLYAYIYLYWVYFGSNAPSYTLLWKIPICLSILAPGTAARTRTSTSREIKEKMSVIVSVIGLHLQLKTA